SPNASTSTTPTSTRRGHDPSPRDGTRGDGARAAAADGVGGEAMGDGYFIIIFSGYGDGLNMISPRFLWEGERNWWPCERGTTDQDIARKHQLDRYRHYRIVRD